MKREEKNILSRQRILDAAMTEFSRNGYDAASTNTICSEYGISKGIIYHYFKDRDELYLLCVKRCFDLITEYLSETARLMNGSAEKRLQSYFDARLCFFSENRECLGIFIDAVFSPPKGLVPEIAKRRREFDKLNISVLTSLLESEPLCSGMSVETVVRDFSMYMDYFNLNYKTAMFFEQSSSALLHEHEERCHRQLHILLYGVLNRDNER